jgi:hypothetical protein
MTDDNSVDPAAIETMYNAMRDDGLDPTAPHWWSFHFLDDQAPDSLHDLVPQLSDDFEEVSTPAYSAEQSAYWLVASHKASYTPQALLDECSRLHTLVRGSTAVLDGFDVEPRRS